MNLLILILSIVWYNKKFIFWLYINHSLSIKAAAPIPVPMHIETTPYFFLVLISSGIKVAICLLPVQPSGCPKAIAPPFGFNFSFGIPSFSIL